MTTISVSDARRTLPAQIDLVQAGERVEITRHGQIVAVLVHPSVLRSCWRRPDEGRSRRRTWVLSELLS